MDGHDAQVRRARRRFVSSIIAWVVFLTGFAIVAEQLRVPAWAQVGTVVIVVSGMVLMTDRYLRLRDRP